MLYYRELKLIYLFHAFVFMPSSRTPSLPLKTLGDSKSALLIWDWLPISPGVLLPLASLLRSFADDLVTVSPTRT